MNDGVGGGTAGRGTHGTEGDGMVGMAAELRGVGLTFRGGKVEALTGVDLSLHDGVVTGLVGRNGAGKTSLLRVLAGWEPRFTGAATRFGRSVLAGGGDVVLAGEQWPLAADQRILDLATHLARVHPGFDHARLADLLARYDVRLRATARSLSRGRRSAALLALALATRAPLTLLDEPMLGMDAPTRLESARIITEELEEAPRAIVLSTHLVEESEPLFERLVLLDRGSVVAHESVAELTRGWVRVFGPADQVAALPRRGDLHHLGGRASAVVPRDAAGSLPSEAVTLTDLTGLLADSFHTKE